MDTSTVGFKGVVLPSTIMLHHMLAIQRFLFIGNVVNIHNTYVNVRTVEHGCIDALLPSLAGWVHHQQS